MSLDNKDESQLSNGGGASGVGGRKTSVVKPPAEQTLKCPRCDSPNTKFCYYNNYSLTQPRHFCKTCRRYWTKGGALCNVPIGGGCRKSRKTRSGSSRFNNNNGDSTSKVASLDMGELSLFNGLTPPAMDYQLGGLNQFSATPINPPPFMNLDSLGFNFPFVKQDLVQEIGITNDHLVSSIESFTSMNQELHWKLQQQRLAALFNGGGAGGSDRGGGGGIMEQQSQTVMESQAQKLQPIFFENILDHAKTSQTTMAAGNLIMDDHNGDLETEWFFDGGYASVNVDPTAGVNPPTDGNNSGNYENGSVSNWNNNGIQGSNQFNQYNALP